MIWPKQNVLYAFKMSMQKKFVKWRNFLPSIVILYQLNFVNKKLH